VIADTFNDEVFTCMSNVLQVRAIHYALLLLVWLAGTSFLMIFGIRHEAPPVFVLRWKLHYSRGLRQCAILQFTLTFIV